MNKPTIDEIVTAVGRTAKIGRRELLGQSRVAHIATARNYAFELCRREGFSLHEIGRAFGRHHTTVLSGANVAKQRIQNKMETA